MQVTEILSDGLRRGYAVTIPAADIESRRVQRLAELARTVRLPGFRPGKIPAGIVQQRFGASVSTEVLEQVVHEATDKLVAERGIRPAAPPTIALTNAEGADAGPDLAFHVELEVLPEIAVPSLADLTLTRFRTEPAPEEIEKAVAAIAARNRDFEPVAEDRGAEIGDVLTLEVVGKVDGVTFAGGAGQDQRIELGGADLVPGFSEGLLGLRPGEKRTVSITFPENYPKEDLAGKPAMFEVHAKALDRPKLQAIDDAFAEKIGFETLAELREVLIRQLQREYDSLSRLRIKRQLLDALAERADFPVPLSLVDREFAGIWQRLEQERAAGRPDQDDAGKDEATLRAEYRVIAERRVRLGLLLSEIGRLNGISVQPDEVNRALRAEASRYSGQEQQVLTQLRANTPAMDRIRGSLFEDKVIDYVIELATVTDQLVPQDQLTAFEAEERDEGEGVA